MCELEVCHTGIFPLREFPLREFPLREFPLCQFPLCDAVPMHKVEYIIL